MNWHYMDGDKQIGPLTVKEIGALIEADKLTEDTLVWNETLSGWARLIDSGLVEIEEEPSPTIEQLKHSSKYPVRESPARKTSSKWLIIPFLLCAVVAIFLFAISKCGVVNCSVNNQPEATRTLPEVLTYVNTGVTDFLTHDNNKTLKDSLIQLSNTLNSEAKRIMPDQIIDAGILSDYNKRVSEYYKRAYNERGSFLYDKNESASSLFKNDLNEVIRKALTPQRINIEQHILQLLESMPISDQLDISLGDSSTLIKGTNQRKAGQLSVPLEFVRIDDGYWNVSSSTHAINRLVLRPLEPFSQKTRAAFNFFTHESYIPLYVKNVMPDYYKKWSGIFETYSRSERFEPVIKIDEEGTRDEIIFTSAGFANEYTKYYSQCHYSLNITPRLLLSITVDWVYCDPKKDSIRNSSDTQQPEYSPHVKVKLEFGSVEITCDDYALDIPNFRTANLYQGGYSDKYSETTRKRIKSYNFGADKVFYPPKFVLFNVGATYDWSPIKISFNVGPDYFKECADISGTWQMKLIPKFERPAFADPAVAKRLAKEYPTVDECLLTLNKEGSILTGTLVEIYSNGETHEMSCSGTQKGMIIDLELDKDNRNDFTGRKIIGEITRTGKLRGSCKLDTQHGKIIEYRDFEAHRVEARK